MSKKERNIRRGIFFFALGLIILLLLGSVSKPKTAAKYISYEVKPGDTLWRISTEYKPKGMRYDEYIYLVQKYNGIGADIYPGQVIKILNETDNA